MKEKVNIAIISTGKGKKKDRAITRGGNSVKMKL